MTSVLHQRPLYAARRQVFWLYAGIVACILILGWSFMIAGEAVFALAVVVAVGWALYTYPRQGLYAIVAVICVVEGSSGFPIVRQFTFVYNSVAVLAGVPGFSFSLIEIAIGVVFASLVAHRKAYGMKTGDLFWPWALLCLALVPGVLRGIYSGGDPAIAGSVIRPLFYVPVIYLLAINLIKEKKHLREFTAVLLVAISVMSMSALWVQFTLIRPGRLNTSIDVAFLSHENALFAALVVLLTVGTVIWGKGSRQRLIMLIPGAIALGGILVLKRRVGLVALDFGLVLLLLAFIKQRWQLAIVLLPLFLIFAGGYLAAYWNADGSLGQPARAVRAVMGDDTQAEDVSSKAYRDAEAFNVEWNIRQHPLLGGGFGKEYVFVRPVPDLTGFWSYQHYTPHNSVLAIWMNGGIIPFVLLLGGFGHAMMKGMATARRRADPLLRAWGLAAAGTVPMVFLFGWQDLGLNSVRVMTVMGVAMAMVTIVGVIGQKEEEEAARPATPATGGAV